jgi:RNA polymerase sigma factor (sigma-70 family)
MSPHPTPVSASDAALAATLDDAALTELERRYRARLWGYFLGLGFDGLDADILIQEVFIKLVVKGPGVFNPQRTGHGGRRVRFKAWLFRVARNLAVDHWRKAKRRPVLFSSLNASGAGDQDKDAAFEARLQDVDGERERDSLEQVQGLREALADCRRQLRKREDRVIVLWVATEGKIRLREIAKTLGVTTTTVPHRLLRRAFEKLQKCLSGKGYSAYGCP